MAVEDKLHGSTEGPYEQFEKCDKKNCIYYCESGTCVFETCVIKGELPPSKTVWKVRCKICDDIFTTKHMEMKVPFCQSCLERMLRAEKKPFSCVFCGNKQNHNSKIFLSGICDKCFNALNNAINCGRCQG